MAELTRASEHVRLNLAHLRRQVGLSQTALSRKLAEMGYDLHHTVIAKIESGQKRGIDIDDVVALAAALGVSPLRLCLPLSRQVGEQGLRLTALHTLGAPEAWRWAEQLSPWWDHDEPEVEDPDGTRYKAWSYLRLEPHELGHSRYREGERIVDASGGMQAVLQKLDRLEQAVTGGKPARPKGARR